MARFYFDIDNGVNSLYDEEGTETDSLEAVRHEAISTIVDIARDILPDGDRRVFAIRVRSENDRVISSATMTLISGWIDT